MSNRVSRGVDAASAAADAERDRLAELECHKLLNQREADREAEDKKAAAAEKEYRLDLRKEIQSINVRRALTNDPPLTPESYVKGYLRGKITTLRKEARTGVFTKYQREADILGMLQEDRSRRKKK
jgi:hypothetical protein